jgi:DNA-binding transcriptional MerR regulator
MSYTVGKLAKKFGLSRSTLLYYDSIGLLSPESHRKGEYRTYSEADERRLAQICKYRKAGISLHDIGKILDSPETSLASALHRRFDELNNEIDKLHEQQKVIADLLQNPEMLKNSAVMNKEHWVFILKSSGYSETEMRNWHIGFERTSPESHHRFLKYLGLAKDEIREIQSWAEKENHHPKRLKDE